MKNLLNFMDCLQLNETGNTFEYIDLHTKDVYNARTQCRNFFASFDGDFFYTNSNPYLVYGGYCYKLNVGKNGKCWLLCINANDPYTL